MVIFRSLRSGLLGWCFFCFLCAPLCAQEDSDLSLLAPGGQVLELPVDGPKIDEQDIPVPFPAIDADPKVRTPQTSPFVNRFPKFDDSTWSEPVPVGTAKSQWLTSIYRWKSSSKEPFGRIYLIQPEQEQAKLILKTEQRLCVYDHHAESDRILATWNIGDEQDERGEFVIFEGVTTQNPKAIARWRLPSKQKLFNIGEEIPFAKWIDQETAVVQISNEIHIWNLLEGKSLAIFSTRFPIKNRLSISPGHRYLAIPIGNGCYLIDLPKRKLIGKISYQDFGLHQAAFSPDGSKIALAGGSHILVWDLTTGKPLQEAVLDEVIAGWKDGDIVWTSNDRLFSRHIGLFDIDTLLPIGKYKLPDSSDLVSVSQGLAVYDHPEPFLLFSRPKTFASFDMPSAPSKQLTTSLHKAIDDVWRVYPQVQVAMSIEGAEEADSAKLRDRLSKAFQRAKWVQSEKSPLQLVATVAPGPAQKVRLTKFENFMPVLRETVEIQPEGLTLALRYKGNDIWNAELFHEILFGRIEENETVDQAAARLTKFNLNETDPIILPTHVLRRDVNQHIPRFRFELGQWKEDK